MTADLPRVRVVVLTFDGGQMTIDCLASLRALDWPTDRLEVILVDNGSLDDVAERVRAEFPEVVVLEPLENLGFAGGCNLGIRHGVDGPLAEQVDHVALLNNDATVDPQWLRRLVERMESSSDIGGVASKMLFADRFHGITLTVDGVDESDPGQALGVCLSAVRIGDERDDDRLRFDEGFHGPVDPDRARDEEFARWTRATAELRLVARDANPQPGRVALRLSAKQTHRVTLISDIERVEVTVGEGGERVAVWAEIEVGADTFDAINNVGSELYRFGFAGDRGFTERDQGQFETSEEVFAWCGGAALLRASHLDQVGLFDEHLFLYYEDTDLAWRARRAGWRHVYEPRALVRHRHAQTSGVGSDVFRFHTERNRLLITARNAPLRLVLLTGLAEARHCLRVNLALLVKRPLTLKMPSRVEPRHRRRVLAAYLRSLPSYVMSRRESVPASIPRSVVHRQWERSKW